MQLSLFILDFYKSYPIGHKISDLLLVDGGVVACDWNTSCPKFYDF